MITRTATAICAAIFLVTISNEANAARSSNVRLSNIRVDHFCGDRYCGQTINEPRQKIARKKFYKQARKVANKEIRPKAVQVASIGNEPLGEAPQGNSLLATAKGYLGTNPTGWRSLWCARFIAVIAPKTAETLKRMGLNPNWARDYAKLPGSKPNGQIGDLVILSRGRGGHIGVLAGFKAGNPIIISGNHIGRGGNRFVGTSTYPKHRVIAYASI